MPDIGSVGQSASDPYGSGHFIPLRKSKGPPTAHDEGAPLQDQAVMKGAGGLGQRLRDIAERMMDIQSALVSCTESERGALLSGLAAEQVAMENLLSLGRGPGTPDEAMAMVKDIAGLVHAPNPQSVNRLLGN